MPASQSENSRAPQFRDRPHLIFLPAEAMVDDKPFGRQPILFAADGTVIWPVTAWLRHVREFGRSEATVEQYGKRMARFFAMLSQYDGGRDWKDVDDKILKAWSNWQRNGQDAIADSTWNDELSTVLVFYTYAQERGWVEGIIGRNDADKAIRFPIAISRQSNTGKFVQGIKHPLHVLTAGKSEIPYVPNSVYDEITAKLATNGRGDLAERNIIMVDWALQTTLRRSEIPRLLCKQIPSRKKIEKIEAEFASNGYSMSLPVLVLRSKRGGEREVQVPLELLRRTREWIDGPRKALLETKKKRETSTKNTDEVFISLKTGLAITGQALSNAFRKAAVRADLQRVPALGMMRPAKVRLHDTRHSAITNLLAGYLDSGMKADEAILTVQQLAGHRSHNSTAQYAHLANKAIYDRSSEAVAEMGKRNEHVRQRAAIDSGRIAAFAAAMTETKTSYRALRAQAGAIGLTPQQFNALLVEAAATLSDLGDGGAA